MGERSGAKGVLPLPTKTTNDLFSKKKYQVSRAITGDSNFCCTVKGF